MALLDRESMYVKNNVYEATFLAFDNGKSGKSLRPLPLPPVFLLLFFSLFLVEIALMSESLPSACSVSLSWKAIRGQGHDR